MTNHDCAQLVAAVQEIAGSSGKHGEQGSPFDLVALRIIHGADGRLVEQGRLTDLMETAITRSAVTRCIARLVDQKLVQQVPGPSGDRRTKALVLTTEGARVAQLMIDRFAAA